MGEGLRSSGLIQWRRWRAWLQATTNRRILAAAIMVGGITFAVSLLVVLKDLVVAYRFGTAREVDAYLIAWLLPALLLNVLAESFSAALMPTYIAVREADGEPAARQLLANATVWAAGVLVVVSVILGAASPLVLKLVGARFEPAELNLTRTLFLVLLPVLVLNGLATVWSAVLNAGHRFASAALAGMTVPVAAIACLVVFGPSWGIVSLAAGTLLGYMLKCVWVAFDLRRRGLWVRPAWNGVTPELRQVIAQYIPAVGASLLMGSTLLVDQAMAARLESGSVAALTYGNKVIGFAVTLGSLSLGTAVLPFFSQMVARKQWAELRRTTRVYTGLILALTIPVTVLLFVFSEPLVRVLFERGAFSAADTAVVSKVQAFFALQIPFFLVGTLYVRLTSALRRNDVLLWGTGISVVVNVGLNLVFIRWLGVPGIALSTSAVYLIAMLFLGVSLLRTIGDRGR